jgi:hypothetical protein
MQQRGLSSFEHRRADIDLGDAKGRATLHLVKRVPLPPCNASGTVDLRATSSRR